MFFHIHKKYFFNFIILFQANFILNEKNYSNESKNFSKKIKKNLICVLLSRFFL